MVRAWRKAAAEGFIVQQKDTKDHWLDIFEKQLRKEVLEECNIQIKNIGYVSSLALIRPNGFLL